MKELVRPKIQFLFFIVFVSSFFSFENNREQSSNYFVQFRVLTIPNEDAANEIDEKMKSKKGVIDSNADHVSSTYFCLISPETQYGKEQFISWFAKMGYEIVCFTKGIQNVDAVTSPHILKNCVEEKTE